MERNNFIKEVKRCTERYKTLLKKIKEYLNKWDNILFID
jgi:hypothetical protein